MTNFILVLALIAALISWVVSFGYLHTRLTDGNYRRLGEIQSGLILLIMTMAAVVVEVAARILVQ